MINNDKALSVPTIIDRVKNLESSITGIEGSMVDLKTQQEGLATAIRSELDNMEVKVNKASEMVLTTVQPSIDKLFQSIIEAKTYTDFQINIQSDKVSQRVTGLEATIDNNTTNLTVLTTDLNSTKSILGSTKEGLVATQNDLGNVTGKLTEAFTEIVTLSDVTNKNTSEIGKLTDSFAKSAETTVTIITDAKDLAKIVTDNAKVQSDSVTSLTELTTSASNEIIGLKETIKELNSLIVSQQIALDLQQAEIDEIKSTLGISKSPVNEVKSSVLEVTSINVKVPDILQKLGTSTPTYAQVLAIAAGASNMTLSNGKVDLTPSDDIHVVEYSLNGVIHDTLPKDSVISFNISNNNGTAEATILEIKSLLNSIVMPIYPIVSNAVNLFKKNNLDR